MNNIYPKGSEWRIWDLHIHTPASFHWNGGKIFSKMDDNEKNNCIKKIIEKFNNSNVDVFCIMDYWTFDGYFAIKRFLEINQSIKLKKKLLPGIELRIEAPTDFRLNIHSIISDDVSDQELLDFINSLELLHLEKPLSNEAFIELAKTFDSGKAKKHGFGDPKGLNNEKLLILGQKTAEITKVSFEKAIKKITQGKCLIALPYDTSDGLEKMNWKKHPLHDNYFMQRADIFETRSEDNIKLFFNITDDKNKGYINDFMKTIGGKPKPVFSGSDAHIIADYGKFPSNKITWIKSDPTFEGLKQTIHEPEQRIYIGEIPPKLLYLSENKQYFINSIEIKSKDNSLNEWFDNIGKIEFNTGLISIIGNKGSGKSALADVIGAAGNSNTIDFSFLTKGKFLDHKSVNKYECAINFNDGFHAVKSFKNPEHKELIPSKVVYFSQNFVQNLCEDIDSTRFQEEIDRVIFSHIPQEEKYDSPELKTLVNIKTKTYNDRLNTERNKIKQLNKDIERFEKYILKENREKLKSKLDEKLRQYKQLDMQPPKVIDEPKKALSPEDNESLTQLNTKVTDSEKVIKESKNKLEILSKDRQELILLKGSLENHKLDLDEYVKKISQEQIVTKYKIDVNVLFKYEIKLEGLELVIKDINDDIDKIKKLKTTQEKNHEDSLTEIKKIKQKLSNEQKVYQKYLEEKKNWDDKKKSITGEKNIVDTIEYYKNELNNIDTEIPKKLRGLYSERKAISRNIIDVIYQRKELFPSLYDYAKNYANKRADEFKINVNDFINFESQIKINQDFSRQFLNMINQQRKGTFQGKDNGEEQLINITKKIDCEIADELIELPENIIKAIEFNLVDDPKCTLEQNFDSQLLVDSRAKLYDFLYSFDYVDTNFDITFAGGRVPNLSPGEKGNLLLIFYLLIDKDTRPIIIDQPEDNLDNETIYKKLVPFIREIKKYRQIILVTHNPNLAIVCDSEQIIYASIDKINKNKIDYSYGSIEALNIRNKALDVLEGTEPAFCNRKEKYRI